MNKQVLRSIFLEKRKFLSQEEKVRRDQLLFRHFFSFVNLTDIRLLHIYASIEETKEPDTWRIIEELQKNYPHIQIVLPKTEPNGQLIHSIYQTKDQLKINKWGIPEPAYGDEVLPNELDLILIPMLGFDKKGHRIGYGKGFYDRFLAQVKPTALKIGYTSSVPIDQIPGIEPTDIPMDMCICPLGVFRFNNK